MNHGLFIGIDGGGTHSTAAAAYPDGRIAAVACGGGLNYHNAGVEVVRQRLEGMVSELVQKTGLPAAHICVGMSALDAPADAATTALFEGGSITPGTLDLQSDAYAALMGFTLGQPGVIVICGTGSMLVALDQHGQQHVSGGWGYLLGDAGSSYTLAREGLLAAIDHYEGLADKTALWADAMAFFNAPSPRGLIDCFYPLPPEKVAGFAKHVLIRAAEDDAAALEVVGRNMRRLARQCAHMIGTLPEAFRVGLYGGVFQHNELARRLFGEELARLAPQAQTCQLQCPPELGALIHLFRKQGMPDETILERMKSTYKEFSK